MSIINNTNNDYDDTKYILLVDDEKDILDWFSEYLSSNGFNKISFQKSYWNIKFS
jgi:FixJ family two-component response regulator